MLILGILGLILFIISILITIYALRYIKQQHQYNEEIDEQNKELEKHNKELEEANKHNLQVFNDTIKNIEIQQEKLNNLDKIIDIKSKDQIELSRKAYENYCLTLEQLYKEQEEDYDKYKDALETSYSNLQLKLMREADEAQADLDKIKATRAAAFEAQLREQEIKQQLSFYCLKIKDSDLDDIKILNKIKGQLHEPRILNMLIWTTYFQKPMTTLCNNIVGTDVKCGIYKITNQLNNMCYIGQSVDISKRWKDHAKCGLGIDTPVKNKLYQSMLEDGLQNFSFEVLEFCPKDQLNEKERYYINLYDSYNYGFNNNTGVKGD